MSDHEAIVPVGVEHFIEFFPCDLWLKLIDLVEHELGSLLVAGLQERVKTHVTMRFQSLVILPRQHSRYLHQAVDELLDLVTGQKWLHVGIHEAPEGVASIPLRPV